MNSLMCGKHVLLFYNKNYSWGKKIKCGFKNNVVVLLNVDFLIKWKKT